MKTYSRFFKVTSFGSIAVTFSGLKSDLHLGNQKVALKKLAVDVFEMLLTSWYKVGPVNHPNDKWSWLTKPYKMAEK